MKRIPPEVLDVIGDLAPSVVSAGVTAISEAAAAHAERVRQRACFDLVVLRHRLDRQRAEAKKLAKGRLLARAIKGLAIVRTKRKLGRASDNCAALGVSS